MDYKPVDEKYFFNGEEYICPLALAMDIIGGKWKAMFLFHLQWGPLRSSEIKRRIKGDISNKIFTQIARELEKGGIVHREVYPEVPPKVEYSLTELGESVIPHIVALAQWGRQIGTKKDTPEIS